MSFKQYVDSLHETTLDLIRYRDLNTLLPQIIERAVKLIGGNRGFIYLVAPDGESMHQSTAYGFKIPFHDDVVIRRGVGISGTVWETRKPEIIYNYAQWENRLTRLDEPVIHIAAVPLLLDDEVVGVMSVLKDAPDAVYTDDEMKMLTSLADLAAIAIENSRLYEHLKRSEHFKQQIANLMPGVIFVHDLVEGRNVYTNPGVARLLGVSQEQMSGKDQSALISYAHPDDVPMLAERINAFLNGTEEEAVIDLRLRHASGEWRWFQTHITVFQRDKAGKPTQILGILQDTHDRRQTEESLRMSESRLRAIFESAAVGIAIGGTDNLVQMANPTFYRMLGYTAEELRTTVTAREYTHPEDLAKEDALVAELLSGNREHFKLEKRYIRKDGEVIWVRMTASLTDDGTMQGIIIVEDVTARKQAQDALIESESRFRTLIEHAPESIFVYDADSGLIVDANQNAVKHFGYSLEELCQMTPLDLLRLPEGDLRDLRRLTEAVIKLALRGESPTINARGQTASGEIRHFELRLVRLPGEKPLLRVSALDVTERMTIEQALRESESRFRRLMEVLPIGVFIYQNDELVYINPNGAGLTGYAAEDALDNKFWELLHPDTREEVAARIVEFADTGAFPSRLEAKIYDREGNIRWFDVSLVEFDLNNLPAVLGTVVDITERKNAEHHAVALLLEKERVKLLADFVRDASHDFRTPLSTINTSVYLLNRLDDEEKRQYHIEMLKTQVKHLDKLVSGLLTLSQLDSGIPFHFAPYNVAILLDELRAGLDTDLRNKGLTLTIHQDASLPQVIMDNVQVSRALREIASNAVRHTPEGGKITISAHANEHYVFIMVRDTGVGIAPENLPRIFDRFYRGEESQMAGGLGLGLSIARKIIEYHNGEITATSAVDQGCIFTVRLPIGGKDA